MDEKKDPVAAPASDGARDVNLATRESEPIDFVLGTGEGKGK